MFATTKPRPPAVTAGAEIPPSAPVKVCRLLPDAADAVAVALLVWMRERVGGGRGGTYAADAVDAMATLLVAAAEDAVTVTVTAGKP